MKDTLTCKPNQLGRKHTFRISPELEERFDKLAAAGGFNKSAVLRNLLRMWCGNQEVGDYTSGDPDVKTESDAFRDYGLEEGR